VGIKGSFAGIKGSFAGCEVLAEKIYAFKRALVGSFRL